MKVRILALFLFFAACPGIAQAQLQRCFTPETGFYLCGGPGQATPARQKIVIHNSGQVNIIVPAQGGNHGPPAADHVYEGSNVPKNAEAAYDDRYPYGDRYRREGYYPYRRVYDPYYGERYDPYYRDYPNRDRYGRETRRYRDGYIDGGIDGRRLRIRGGISFGKETYEVEGDIDVYRNSRSRRGYQGRRYGYRTCSFWTGPC